MTDQHVEPTEASTAALLERDIDGPVEMLNLLRFRDVADYARSPELAPETPVSGREAYDRYSEHTLPLLAEVGAEVVRIGRGSAPLVGPADERWDLMLLVRYPDVATFLGMVTSSRYLRTAGHRTAALADARLHPLEPVDPV